MQLSIDALELQKAIAAGIARPSPMQVISHAHLRAEEGALVVTTTDTMRTISVRLPASVERKGAATAPPALLRAALNGLPGTVQLTLKDHTLTVVHDGSYGPRRFRMASLDPEAFPMPEATRFEPWLAGVKAGDLAEALRRVEYAAGRDDMRPFLNGVVVLEHSIQASDGFRLVKVPLPGDEVENPTPLIIPTIAVRGIADALAAGAKDETLQLQIARNGSKSPALLRVVSATVEYTTSLVDHRFPDGTKLIPKHADTPIEVHGLEVDPLLAAVERLLPFCERAVNVGGREHNEFTCRVRGEPGGLLTLENAIEGALAGGSEAVPAEISGTLEFVLNARYLREALQSLRGEGPIDWYFGAPGSTFPTLLQRKARGDQHLIMGVRL